MCPIENAFFYKDEQQQQQRVEKVIFKQTLPDIIKIVIIMIIMTWWVYTVHTHTHTHCAHGIHTLCTTISISQSHTLYIAFFYIHHFLWLGSPPSFATFTWTFNQPVVGVIIIVMLTPMLIIFEYCNCHKWLMNTFSFLK